MIKDLQILRDGTDNINEWLDLKHIIEYITNLKAGGFYHDIKTTRWLEFLLEKARYNQIAEATLLEKALEYIRSCEREFYNINSKGAV